jgi:SAM-dependent methyltransferase
MYWLRVVWRRVVESVKLFVVSVEFWWFSFFEFIKVAARYYGDADFRKWDLYLLWKYAFSNPYSISKKYLVARGASDPYLYGETPLTAMEKIAKRFHISATDMVYELGCGRGRTCFWLAAFVKCQVVGVELIPTFVGRALEVKNKYGVMRANFICRDVLDIDYSIATCIYFFGTSSSEDFIAKLISKLSQLKPGAKVITVSYPLTDYMRTPIFRLVDKMTLSFGFEEVDVYLQLRV